MKHPSSSGWERGDTLFQCIRMTRLANNVRKASFSEVGWQWFGHRGGTPNRPTKGDWRTLVDMMAESESNPDFQD